MKATSQQASSKADGSRSLPLMPDHAVDVRAGNEDFEANNALASRM
jgi:hypothetical protein